MRSCVSLLAGAIVVLVACAVFSCGGDDLAINGALLPTRTPVPTATPGGWCLASGQACSSEIDCCSGICASGFCE